MCNLLFGCAHNVSDCGNITDSFSIISSHTIQNFTSVRYCSVKGRICPDTAYVSSHFYSFSPATTVVGGANVWLSLKLVVIRETGELQSLNL